MRFMGPLCKCVFVIAHKLSLRETKLMLSGRPRQRQRLSLLGEVTVSTERMLSAKMKSPYCRFVFWKMYANVMRSDRAAVVFHVLHCATRLSSCGNADRLADLRKHARHSRATCRPQIGLTYNGPAQACFCCSPMLAVSVSPRT